MLNELKDKIQQEALVKWLENDKKGTAELATGVGKTILALHALYTMDKSDLTHVFLAETTERKKDLLKDIKKYNQIFNRDVTNDYNLKFYCYQTVYKWKDKKLGLVIADEIHDSLSPKYSEFYFNNNYEALLGLSATVDRKTKYEENNQIFTKGELLDKIAPVVFKYTINDSQLAGVSRKLNIYVINHQLEEVEKTVKAGSLKKSFLQTEKASYDYWDKEHKRSWFLEDQELKTLKIRITSHKRSNLLFNLPSKVNIIKQLINTINGKTIIFGNSLDALLKITPNVVSSKNDEKKNDFIRYNFDNDKIDIIASFKKLKQGANLDKIDNCIIHSYYGVEKDIIQRVGRLRQNGDKVGNVFIILTTGTQEEVWFQKMMENMNDFTIINCDNIKDCIKKYKINEKN
jgi:superfamily II DNA or RNA helicase